MIVVRVEVRLLDENGSHLLATATDVPDSLSDLSRTMEGLTALITLEDTP